MLPSLYENKAFTMFSLTEFLYCYRWRNASFKNNSSSEKPEIKINHSHHVWQVNVQYMMKFRTCNFRQLREPVSPILVTKSKHKNRVK